MIPNLTETIRYISMKLNDQERSILNRLVNYGFVGKGLRLSDGPQKVLDKWLL